MPSSFEIQPGKKGKALLKSIPVSGYLFCRKSIGGNPFGNLDFNRALCPIKIILLFKT